MGNYTSVNNLVKEKEEIILDNLSKELIINYTQSLNIRKIRIDPKLIKNQLASLELTNNKIIPMCIELYEKLYKLLPGEIKAVKTEYVEPEFDPDQIIQQALATVLQNNEQYYTVLNEMSLKLNTNFNILPITIENLNESFKELKTSQDMCGISKKICYHLPNYIKQRFINSFNNCLEHPETIDFNFGKATYKYKKDDDKDIKNYRRIMAIPVFINIFHRILAIQIDNYFRTNNIIDTTIQKAGISNQKTPILQQIIKIKEIIKDSNDNNKKLALMFIDVKDAFGSLDRKALFIILEKYGVDIKFINYLKTYYDQFVYFAKIKNKNVNNVPWVNGLIQGCPLSPLLFITALNYIFKKFISENENLGYNFNNVQINMCAYMDDIVLVCNDVDALSIAYYKIVELLKLIGMELNVAKTSILLNGYTDDEIKNINIDNINISDKFVYLGCLVTKNINFETQFNEFIKKISRLLYQADIQNTTDETRINEYTELIHPFIVRTLAKLYDLPKEYKLKILAVIKTYFTKWNYNNYEIFPNFENLVKDCDDNVIRTMDPKKYDKHNIDDTDVESSKVLTFNKPIGFEYGKE
ncbi:reverse transcriptase [Hokovirus HKV1]|uniref:Reverse transcriptase n=1 Tax=Hokovirus HKV1 TaxID=1977638 RepID=A0A1V0SEZ1_9VIRU|nr:reverse transcriptase [Hokovirus HKV1]